VRRMLRLLRMIGEVEQFLSDIIVYLNSLQGDPEAAKLLERGHRLFTRIF